METERIVYDDDNLVFGKSRFLENLPSDLRAPICVCRILSSEHCIGNIVQCPCRVREIWIAAKALRDYRRRFGHLVNVIRIEPISERRSSGLLRCVELINFSF